MRDDIATLRAKYEAAKNRYAVGDKVVLYPDGGRQVEKKPSNSIYIAISGEEEILREILDGDKKQSVPTVEVNKV